MPIGRPSLKVPEWSIRRYNLRKLGNAAGLIHTIRSSYDLNGSDVISSIDLGQLGGLTVSFCATSRIRNRERYRKKTPYLPSWVSFPNLRSMSDFHAIPVLSRFTDIVERSNVVSSSKESLKMLLAIAPQGRMESSLSPTFSVANGLHEDNSSAVTDLPSSCWSLTDCT